MAQRKARKPSTLTEYKKWLNDNHRIDLSRIENHYGSVTARAKEEFQRSGFWFRLLDRSKEFDQQYLVTSGYKLFQSDDKPLLLTKPFDSVLNKSFRRNILENKNWPQPPIGGWVLPPQWFGQIKDLIRTLLVVKYMDGVAFLVDKLESIASELELKYKWSYQAKEEGYYAAHFYLEESLEVPRIDWDTERVTFKIEIQVTTQLQELIRQMLHKYYEDKRIVPGTKQTVKWQWDYKSHEFTPYYLGHILHYVEGMILEVRDKQKGTNL